MLFSDRDGLAAEQRLIRVTVWSWAGRWCARCIRWGTRGRSECQANQRRPVPAGRVRL